jgi:hypothetical protein
MPLDPMTPFLSKWNQRVTDAQSAGIPVTALAPVFKADLARLQAGGTPYTDDEAGLAVLSNYAGSPALHQVQQKPDWNPVNLLGRAVGDIGTIGKGLIGLPRQIARDVAHIGQLPGQLAQGVGEIGQGHIGEGLQRIAGAPGLNEALLAASFLIPGGEAATAPLASLAGKAFAGTLAAGEVGKALTPEGRKDISQHPLVNLLGVLPVASEAGLTAKLNEAARASAVGRATTRAAENLGVSAPYREVWRTFSDARKQAHTKVEGFWAQANELFGRHTPEEMGQITAALKKGSPEAIAAAETQFPGFAQVKSSYDDLQSQMAGDTEHFVQLPGLTPGGPTEVYPVRSLPARTWDTLNKRKDQLAVATDTLDRRTQNLAASQARLDAVKVPSTQSILDRMKPELDAELAADPLKSKLGPAAEAIRAEDFGPAKRLLHDAGRHDLADEVGRIRPAMREVWHAQQQVDKAQELVQSASATHEQLKTKVARQDKAFRKSLEMRPAARWHPNVTDEFHQGVERWAQDFYSGDPARLTTATSEIANRYYRGTFDDGTPIFPAKALRQVEKDAVKRISEWQAQGWNPSFVHSMNESQLNQLRYPKVARTEPKISSYKEKLLTGGSDEVNNVAVSLTHQQAEVAVNGLWRDAWHGYADDTGAHVPGILDTFGKTYDQAVQELRDRQVPLDQARKQVAREWENPARFSGKVGRGSVFANNNVLIPSSLARNLDKLSPSMDNLSQMKAAVDKGTRGFRFAVTGLSPQHSVHIVASGGVMFGLAMNDLPAVLRSVGEARRMIKEGRIPLRFQDEGSFLPAEDAMMFGASQRTAARLYSDVVAKGVHPLRRANEAIQHLDEHVTRWYKTLDYVAQTKRGLDPEQALYEVSRHFADHAGRAPIERALFKSVAPFGAWSQHLIRYLFQFPADHPLRAAALANLATAQIDDQNSGLPRDFNQLFFHNKQAFDIRSLNPFRDIGNTFSLAGFISTLHPAVGAIFKAKGYNPVTDTAELYPELTIDPNTGKLVTKGGNFFKALAEGMIPQTQGIEALLGWSDSMRNLKKNDPQAYAHTLARYLHFPWLPRTIDLGTERTKDQVNQLRLATAAVSDALKTGNFGGIHKFNMVPFQGQMVPPKIIEQLYQLAKQGNPAFPANVVLR